MTKEMLVPCRVCGRKVGRHAVACPSFGQGIPSEDGRAAPQRASLFGAPIGGSIPLQPHHTRQAVWLRTLLLALLLGAAGACTEQGSPEVEIEAVRLGAEDTAAWARPVIESGQYPITVRQVFTAQGPCRILDARLMRRYPGEYLLRVEARELLEPCGEETPHIGYTATLRGLPAGTHGLRIVHVGADGRTLAEAVLEHPIVVTEANRE